uniref:OmpA family protein n=1 Tax=Spongiimicrobium sp. 3-5 TaxID=3332596 RepID=UPI00397F9079
INIDVRSHTDSRANDAYNMALSGRRAKSTVDYLISKGISKTRLTSKGYGESQLVNHCSNGVPCTKAEHQLNRRSEFIVELKK